MVVNRRFMVANTKVNTAECGYIALGLPPWLWFSKPASWSKRRDAGAAVSFMRIFTLRPLAEVPFQPNSGHAQITWGLAYFNRRGTGVVGRVDNQFESGAWCGAGKCGAGEPPSFGEFILDSHNPEHGPRRVGLVETAD